jgi:hypothetical protein
VIDRRRFGLGLGTLTLLPVTAHARPKGKIGYLHPDTIDPSHITFLLLKQAGATHFLMKTLPRVATEMALHVLAYNLTRVMNIMGIQPLMAAMRA